VLTLGCSGYGYQVRFVEDLENIDLDLAASMDWAISQIQHIQKAARSGNPIVKPRWPVILLRTPKGWGAPKKVHGEFVEGSFRSHQVPLPKASSDKEELGQLQEWLREYQPDTLFKRDGSPSDNVIKIIPKDALKRMGVIKDAFSGYKPLDIPDWIEMGEERGQEVSSMKAVGALLDQVLQRNPSDMRIFSPDELESNKLDAVLKHTGRNFQWDQYSRQNGGRVIEILSEHTCQGAYLYTVRYFFSSYGQSNRYSGMMQGYTLTGRSAILPSYESFLGIIHTMMVQYSKFRKIVSLSEDPPLLNRMLKLFRAEGPSGERTQQV
jgi:xylulose-5-phosphate/fructose-6-phosphate phosphoketolase